MKNSILLLILLAIIYANCKPETPRKLPHLGIPEAINNGDTVWPKIPDFSFINQDSQLITNITFDDQIYVADFFFTHCPTICPKVKKQMLRLYERYENNPHISLLSHTIDQKHDTIGRLNWFAKQLGVKAPKWQFVTGDKAAIYEMPKHYLSIAIADSDAPGGYNHSGYVVLIDKNRNIRSFADGTIETEIDRFIKDIDLLLNEQFSENKMGQ